MTKFLNRKRSLILELVSLTILLIALNNIAHSAVSFQKTEKQVMGQRIAIEEILINLPKAVEKNELDMPTILMLRSAFDVASGKLGRLFDFFIVKKNGNPLIESSNLIGLENYFVNEDGLHQEVKTPEQTLYVSKKTIGKYEIILGYFPVSDDAFKNTTEAFKKNPQSVILLFLSLIIFLIKSKL